MPGPASNEKNQQQEEETEPEDCNAILYSYHAGCDVLSISDSRCLVLQATRRIGNRGRKTEPGPTSYAAVPWMKTIAQTQYMASIGYCSALSCV